VRSEAAFLGPYIADYPQPRPWMTLDIGSGPQPCNPFNADHVRGIDIVEAASEHVICADLFGGSIPFADDKIDFITASQFIEHVPRVAIVDGNTHLPFIELMNELHRILKRGGLFYSATPAFPYKSAFVDPTHVNIITEETFPYYFCTDPHSGPWARRYGFNGVFEMVDQRWHGSSLLSLMRKLP
jgi:SAM-dependent methyltransferase